MQGWTWPALLALGLALPAGAQQKPVPPPAEWAGYIAAVRKADDTIADLEKRCVAYPDLPGAEWPEGAGKARCALLRPPIYTLSQMESLLDRPDGAAELDKRFAALLDAHYADPAQREQIFIAYHPFDASSQAERVASRWRKASPDSVYAETALGYAYTRQGWQTRGGKYARETPEAKLAKMRGHFLAALELLGDALKREPRMLPACMQMAGIGRMSSDQVQQYATSACMKADPHSFFVVDEMANAAEPKWGGSAQAMRDVAAYAVAHAKKNPMLYVFAADGIGYEASNGSDWDAKLAELMPAAKIAPNAGYLRDVGTAYVVKNEDWKALVYLSQALRFMPYYVDEARLRASLLSGLGYPKWALGDARRAVETEPSNGLAQITLAFALADTEGEAAARPHFQLAMNDPETREAAYPNYCRGYLLQKDYKHAGACTAELVEEFPENGEAWNLRAWYLDAQDDPRFRQAVEKFFKYQNAQRWPDHARVSAELKKRLSRK